VIKTVILCGGRGSRLKPLTDLIPKPLVTLNGKPLLQHILNSYLGKGVTDFVLCVGYREHMIRDFLASQEFSATFEFSNAGEKAGILQRLYHARALLGDRVFVVYGDTLIDVDLDAMLAQHQASEAQLTITIASGRSPFGLVNVDETGWVTWFEEKPLQMYYIGHMLLERTLLEDLDPQLLALPDGDGLIELFQRLITKRQLQTYLYSGFQITFNTHQERDQAERDFITYFTHQEV
jgi:glucose-1-phosphate cytidylyltransferase